MGSGVMSVFTRKGKLKKNMTITVFVVLASFLSFVSARSTFITSSVNNYTILSGKFPWESNVGGICATMIEPWGYTCEEHTVTTSDGYILSMQRIPASHSGKKAYKPPVLLQHGLYVDAVCWLLNPPDQALPYLLADKGHDVWLSNFRGTKYSRGHTSLSPFDFRYWDWSWDELSANDLTAFVEHVYEQSGNEKLHYVGHSLGTLVALAALSQNNLVNMLRSAALLSPIAYMNQLPTPLSKAAAAAIQAQAPFWLALGEINPKLPVVTELVGSLCDRLRIDCTNFMTPFTGKNCCLNSSIIKPLVDNELQPSSSKNIIHLSQMILRGTITKYDYILPSLNMAVYGQPRPPVYDMASIPNDFPLFLGYGGRDLLSDPNDVRRLVDSLKDHDSDKLTVHFTENYAHADFVFAVNANRVVYIPLMAFFRSH